MARPRKIQSLKRMVELWSEYKHHCDNRLVLTHAFSTKNSEFVSECLKRCTTYTIKGFCVFIRLPRQSFYATYATDKRFCDTFTRMREECEVDARESFELGIIPTQLAGLWMAIMVIRPRLKKLKGTMKIKTMV